MASVLALIYPSCSSFKPVLIVNCLSFPASRSSSSPIVGLQLPLVLSLSYDLWGTWPLISHHCVTQPKPALPSISILYWSTPSLSMPLWRCYLYPLPHPLLFFFFAMSVWCPIFQHTSFLHFISVYMRFWCTNFNWKTLGGRWLCTPYGWGERAVRMAISSILRKNRLIYQKTGLVNSSSHQAIVWWLTGRPALATL